MPISEIIHSLTVVRIFLQDIKMLFGLDKCAILEVQGEDKLNRPTWRPAHQGKKGRLQIPWHFTGVPES